MESGIEAPPTLSPPEIRTDNDDAVVDPMPSSEPSSDPKSSEPASSSSPLKGMSSGTTIGVNSVIVTSSILSTRDDTNDAIDESLPLPPSSTPSSIYSPSQSSLAPANNRVLTPNINVTLGSTYQVGCASSNSPQSTQVQNLESKASDTNISLTLPSEKASSAFVPTLGAWAKPLHFKPPSTPSAPSTPRDCDLAIVGNQLAALWPSLNDEILNKKPKSKHPIRTLQPPIEKLPLPELKADGSLRFPWAARLSPQSRNLFRAASPTYRLDGTPEISIPSKVLKLGPENKDEYIIGKFHKCSLPPGGLIHAVVNKIWGRSCKITCKKISDSSFLFHIPHEATRHWVIQRGVWHIDDCLLFVLPWTPEGTFKIPEISTLPVWVNLKNIPDCCYSRLGISHIASGLGEPILTHKPRLDPTSMGEAKVLVEMELDRDFPKVIALDDKQGSIFLVDVEYTWIPSMCERCGNLGHKEKRCLLPSKPEIDPILPPQSIVVSSEVPVVDIDCILQQRESSAVHHTEPKSTSDKEGETTINVNEAIQANVEVAAMLPSDSSEIGTESSMNQMLSSSPLPQQEKPTDPLNSVITSTILVDSQSTPTGTPIMDSYPSNIVNKEVFDSSDVDQVTTSPNHCTYESPSRFTLLGNVDEAENEPSNSFGLTRGGRESKPPIKYQNLEWNSVRGKGKRGRRGRGSIH